MATQEGVMSTLNLSQDIAINAVDFAISRRDKALKIACDGLKSIQTVLQTSIIHGRGVIDSACEYALEIGKAASESLQNGVKATKIGLYVCIHQGRRVIDFSRGIIVSLHHVISEAAKARVESAKRGLEVVYAESLLVALLMVLSLAWMDNSAEKHVRYTLRYFCRYAYSQADKASESVVSKCFPWLAWQYNPNLPSLTDLTEDIFELHILPLLDTESILRLFHTGKFFHSLIGHPTLLNHDKWNLETTFLPSMNYNHWPTNIPLSDLLSLGGEG
jgi:hypothetical protein